MRTSIIISLMVAAFFLVSAIPGSEGDPCKPGDVSGNGIINQTDAAMVADHLLERNILTSGPLTRAEANLDHIIDIADAVWTSDHVTTGLSEMISIPAGTFIMGARDDGDDALYARPREAPRHPVTLSPYEIGRYQVTYDMYCRVINEALETGLLENMSGEPYSGGDVYIDGKLLLRIDSIPCMIEFEEGSFRLKSRDGFSMENHPVGWVSWHGSVAFCNWFSQEKGLAPVYDLSSWEVVDADQATSGLQYFDGYRLPTEAEWERAAAWESASGGKHWIYGYSSDDASSKSMNFGEHNPLGFSEHPYTSSVGYYDGFGFTNDSPSPVGCYDMSGNAWDWCNDWYDENYYQGGAMTDPTGPPTGERRVGRGGSWQIPGQYCRTAYRGHDVPWNTSSNIGFRLCRTPGEK